MMSSSSKKYSDKYVIAIDKEITYQPQKIVLNGKNLTIQEVLAVSRNKFNFELTTDSKVINRIEECFQKMMEDVKNGVPVYGANTGYGAQASRVLTQGSPTERVNLAKLISEGIAHVDVTVGPTFSADVIRAAILIRINMLMQGVSGIKIDDLKIYQQLLNNQITPVVNQYGGIGASGDLAHNGRVLSAARGLKGVQVWNKTGKIVEASEALKKAHIPLLNLNPKAGLGLVNGDNFSSALALLLTVDTLELLLISTVVGAMMIEVLHGTDRSFHPVLSEVRPHPGQREVASLYRYLLKGSKLAYQEMSGHQLRPDGIKVQDAYSLRGISQYQGVNFEKIKSLLEIIEININSVSDNPLWVPPEYTVDDEKPWQWVSGGNFLAMHMVEVMDSLRKIMTQIVKLNDRHLARLVNPNDNNGLPPNLSDKSAITGCAFKGVQIQSGMFEVYSSLLSIPVSTFFGVHEEGNQDITSHALTSGIFGLENLRIARYSIAQNLLAVAQAVDFRGGITKLSPKTQAVYKLIRDSVDYLGEEKPLNNDIEAIYQALINGDLINLIREKVFSEYS